MHINGFLDYLSFEKRVSNDTIMAYQKDLEQFTTYLKDTYQLHSAQEVKTPFVRSWVVQLVEQGRSMSTIKRKLSALKSYFNYLERHQLITKNPMVKIPIPKVSQKLPVYLQENEIDQLFNRIQWQQNFSSQRDRLLLDLLYNTGLRRAELIDLKMDSLDWSNACLRVRGKGAKERLIPFSPSLGNRIQVYLELKHSTFPIVTTNQLLLTNKGKALYPKFVYNKVKHYLSLVSSAEKLSPHVLRHTFATHLSNHGADLNAIKELLGHSSLAATQVYTHNTIDQLKAIYGQAHPKAQSEPNY